jgi:hypothetical protein
MKKEKCKILLESGFFKDWVDGKPCQYSNNGNHWINIKPNDSLDFSADFYRVKPEPEYIPFTAETAVAAGLHKRKVSFNNAGSHTVYIGEESVLICSCVYTFKDVLRSCKFIDTGEKCGVQVGGLS